MSVGFCVSKAGAFVSSGKKFSPGLATATRRVGAVCARNSGEIDAIPKRASKVRRSTFGMAQNHMPKVGKRVQNDAAREIPSHHHQSSSRLAFHSLAAIGCKYFPVQRIRSNMRGSYLV